MKQTKEKKQTKYLYFMREDWDNGWVCSHGMKMKITDSIIRHYSGYHCPRIFRLATGIKLKKGQQVRIPIDKLLEIVEEVK